MEPLSYIISRFYTRGRIIRRVLMDNASMAVSILSTHYPSRRTWASICSSSGYASQVLRRAPDALRDWTNFLSKYVLNDALRKVVRLDT